MEMDLISPASDSKSQLSGHILGSRSTSHMGLLRGFMEIDMYVKCLEQCLAYNK